MAAGIGRGHAKIIPKSPMRGGFFQSVRYLQYRGGRPVHDHAATRGVASNCRAAKLSGPDSNVWAIFLLAPPAGKAAARPHHAPGNLDETGSPAHKHTRFVRFRTNSRFSP